MLIEYLISFQARFLQNLNYLQNWYEQQMWHVRTYHPKELHLYANLYLSNVTRYSGHIQRGGKLYKSSEVSFRKLFVSSNHPLVQDKDIPYRGNEKTIGMNNEWVITSKLGPLLIWWWISIHLASFEKHRFPFCFQSIMPIEQIRARRSDFHWSKSESAFSRLCFSQHRILQEVSQRWREFQRFLLVQDQGLCQENNYSIPLQFWTSPWYENDYSVHAGQFIWISYRQFRP